MNYKRLLLGSIVCSVALLLIALTSCTTHSSLPAPTPVEIDVLVSTMIPQANLPNPASVYCEQQGNNLEIITTEDGSQAGLCVFPDGSKCDEWAFYGGKCKPGSASPVEPGDASDGWNIYRNKALGYSFHYPAEANIENNDEPLQGISIVGPLNEDVKWPVIGISHPHDREEYRPPQGADLLQWLADHYLLGEVRAPDVQIAGTTAIHFRHERSPQSYADDRYYFAVEGQLYMIAIIHTGDREDWTLYNHFLESFQFDPAVIDVSAPAASLP